jgi:hypothetical protein
MRSAMSALRLDRLTVVHAGEHSYDLSDGIRATAARDLWNEVSWSASTPDAPAAP